MEINLNSYVPRVHVSSENTANNRRALQPGQPFNPYKVFTGIFIPEALVQNPNISPGAKIAYGRLARYAGENGDCYPSINALAREMGVKARQAQRYLAELQASKFIQAFARFRSPNIRDTNGYIFLWHETFTGLIRRPGTPVSNVTPPPASHQTPPLVSDMTPKESQPEESPRQESQSSSSTVEKEMKTPPPTPSPRRVQTPEINSSRKETNDDDRSTEQPKAQYKSDHEELIALIEQATGRPPDCKLIGDILDRLKLRETPLREYLNDIRPRLKRLKRCAGPGFFYSQACDPGRSKPAAHEAQRPQTKRCQRCSGIGKTPEGVYCDCSMGRDLARVEKRLASKNLKSEAAA